VLFRDKSASCYAKVANAFMQNAKEFNFKSMIHQDYILAKQLGAFGVHLNSKQAIAIKRAKELGLFVVISTHTKDDIKEAISEGADAVTFSPIFATPNKGKPKGVEALKEVVDEFGKEIKIIALGGIVTNKHIKEIELAKAWGFASIRYFK